MNILAIYAHPDDAEFLASGSMAKWSRQGHQVYAIAATDGSMGTKTVGQARTEVAARRERELSRAMQAIGGHEPIGFWFPDGSLSDHAEALKEKLSFWVRKLRADRIVTLDPWLRYGIHPDHITAGRIASEVAVFSCFPLYFPHQIEAGLECHQPEEVWYMLPTERPPNRIVDIDGTFEQKIQSILCHESQVEMLADWFVPGADPTRLTPEEKERLAAGVRDLMRGMASQVGEKYGIGLAEAFHAVHCGGCRARSRSPRARGRVRGDGQEDRPDLWV
jgi:LmbE family N-acetylglucosaminyl deacetylase